jgi:hypothetical protein
MKRLSAIFYLEEDAGGHGWLMPVTLATREAKIRWMAV